MKQVVIKGGGAVVEKVPTPQLEAGTVLVEVQASCISIGTEMSGVKTSALPLWKRAMRQPENVKKVFESVAQQGMNRTMSLVKGKLSAGNATGYSAAGKIVAVGAGVEGLFLGDRVACAGAQCAHHAEIIRVPSNLAVKVPDNITIEEASTVTLGAIALQGVRRASPTLGEKFVVVGLGVLGQLTMQFLKANGCNVIGIDLDTSRVDVATEHGMDYGLSNDFGSHIDQVARLTDGHGADGVIITAATPSNEVVSHAFKMTRKKGRVVLVGDVGLDLNRADFYAKEIDFFISCSYGPGRYDNNYEERGLDYPLPFVRWTENRNMGQYLSLISQGKVEVKKMVSNVYPLEDASKAYESLKDNGAKALMVLLSYPDKKLIDKLETKVENPMFSSSSKGKVKLAIIGAGGFAKGMHLPNIQKRNDLFSLKAIVSRTGHNAMATAKQFAAEYSSTDFNDVLNDEDINTVVIATRHNLHGKMALEALKSGKNVLLEKPLTIFEDEFREIKDYFSKREETPVLLTGYNRRFSPYVQKIRSLLKNRTNPMIINYKMNAGFLPKDHWTLSPEEGGGRNIGEACHIYDVFTFLTDSEFTSVTVQNICPKTEHYSSKDNFVATFKFKDGSVATLTYTAIGNKEFPKESMEVFCDGLVVSLNDYKKLEVSGNKLVYSSPSPEKGQMEEIVAFATSINEGKEWPIPLWQQFQVTEMAFAVDRELV
ncbi:Gfo/Idh/MocA family oxidoreductase [Halobacteriovorax sp. JY17]|uniref:Gfo/Idh/MocA family oxidoreductase n=1 Tax=Halobacteriovorax sp. JY17 TaxID=2014617 RepID=UPI000C640760|nr:Gfo/Idh/MocA family oxidoreductase [Halobacteriovorax sp. JY17]PIK15121.1 MAG: oxidoreductase [Halobacteriovorax sp. JY17]